MKMYNDNSIKLWTNWPSCRNVSRLFNLTMTISVSPGNRQLYQGKPSIHPISIYLAFLGASRPQSRRGSAWWSICTCTRTDYSERHTSGCQEQTWDWLRCITVRFRWSQPRVEGCRRTGCPRSGPSAGARPLIRHIFNGVSLCLGRFEQSRRTNARRTRTSNEVRYHAKGAWRSSQGTASPSSRDGSISVDWWKTPCQQTWGPSKWLANHVILSTNTEMQ